MPLLKTKLSRPPLRPGLVSRPQLVARLNAGAHCQLLLVSAPAGFGKTTLLGEWVRQASRPVAWLSLDRDDNAPLRFWTYLVAALQTIAPQIGASLPGKLQAATAPPIETVLAALLNELAELGERSILVIDDYHLISAASIHDGVAYLLHNLAPQLQLVLATRVDPPWSLARLRARGEMGELRRADLCFSLAEAATLLQNLLGAQLSTQDLAALELRTEGWVAGLQLAALSMQSVDAARISEFVRSFSGSHRFVLDYLMEEVLQRQPPEIERFLLKSVLLERMCGPLCDALMGADEGTSQRLLERLERDNMFLVPLDDERRWYRYHQLFADLLRGRLQRLGQAELVGLHRRASAWYERNGLIVEAVGHALAADDTGRVAHLVAGNMMALLARGELTKLLARLDALPADILANRPWLMVARGWAQTYTGRVAGVEELFQQALERGTTMLDPADSAHLAGYVAAIRAYLAELEGVVDRAVELAQRALASLPPDDRVVRGYTATILGMALRMRGDLAGADQASAMALSLGMASDDQHVAVMAICRRAHIQFLRGELSQMARGCRQALQLAGQYAASSGGQLPSAGYAHARMSQVLCERNECQQALYHAKQGVELCERWGQVDILVVAQMLLARVLTATGDLEGARAAIGRAVSAAANMPSWYVALLASWAAERYLVLGDLAPAERWQRESGLRADDPITFETHYNYLSLARVWVAQERWQPALALLERLLALASRVGAQGVVINMLIVMAVARRGQNMRQQALELLAQALTLARPERYVCLFCEGGPPVRDLLQQALAAGCEVTYVGELLAAMDDRRVPGAPPALLADPLSPRELQVLRLLTTHLSGSDIARNLTISENTIRTHIKNIYSKLDVHSRREAVQRAGELDLL